MKTYYALSDVHGREISLKLFKNKDFNLKNENHIIVLNGDFFVRHPLNEEVLTFCETMIDTLEDRFVLVKGNHDEFFMGFIQELEDYNIEDYLDENDFNLERWLRNGARITIDQLFGTITGLFTKEKHEKKKRLMKFSSHIRDYYVCDSYIFTHASININREIDVWDPDFFHKGIALDKIIIIGHTTYKKLDNYKIIEKSKDKNLYTYAVSRNETICPVNDIDNGDGNNITIFEEKD